MNARTVMEDLLRLSEEFEGMEHEIETDSTVCFYSIPQYNGNLKWSAIYGLHSQLKEIDGLVVDILEAEDNLDNEKKDLLYVQIEVGK